MDKKLAVLVIHGMGSQQPDFAEGMIDEVDGRIDAAGRDHGQIAWQPVFWADILAPRETDFLKRARKQGELDYIGLRRFVVGALGDATAYQKLESSENSTYAQIHARLGKAISDLYNQVLGGHPVPLIIMAHSLGGHIMSNYIWDMQKPGAGTGLSPFERLHWLAGIITFGCNIPLFTFAYEAVQAIRFPPTQLSPALKTLARWNNYYDPDDVLGYPLRPIGASYRQTVSKDIAINVGSIFTSWNPMSHSGYWTDNDFTRATTRQLLHFL